MKRSAFTLIELLLVIGIIAVLAGIVILAVNPSTQLLKAQDTKRTAHTREIKSAILQYQIEHGVLPTGITSIVQDICAYGSTATGCVNLDVLVDQDYITTLDRDVLETDADETGFTVVQNAGGFLAVEAEYIGVQGSVAAEPSAVAYTDGSLDETFLSELGTDGGVQHVFNIGSNFVISGDFSNYNGTVAGLPKITPTGSIDPTFNLDIISPGPYAVVVQPDNKILIGGAFSTVNGLSYESIARLNADGSTDTSFTIGSGFDGSIRNIALQSDNKIIVTGEFTSFNGVPKNYIVRLNANGSLDNSFLSTGPDNGSYFIYDAAIQPDDKIIVAGSFSQFNGVARNKIARLNADGSLDTSFNSLGFTHNTLFPQLFALKVTSDNKILVGGMFNTYNGISQNHIMRLLSDGTLDTSFVAGAGASDRVYDIEIQADGKIFIAGILSSYNSSPVTNQAIRLNTNGSLDTSFASDIELDGYIYDLSILPSQKIVIGGEFTIYDGIAANNIAILHNE